ncbi:MAG: ABC transporter substrate-binding protein [Lachnospiraceae bacterium]|nr:ABC transporter substrate-binding protein [Lachnospiraceae bacterium]
MQRKKLKRLTAMMLTAAMTVFCTGLGGILEVSAAESEYKDELHIALGAEPANLDIVANSATVSVEVADGTIFESLVTVNENYEPIPELAESWEISDDNTVYTWHLRQGIKFHNGDEMVAEDVAASLNRWLENAGNAQTMIGETQFVAADTYTVTLTMEKGCAYVNELMGGLGQRAVIMPKSVVDAVDESGLISEYIGTGPYKFVEWKDQQQIHLTRFDEYQPYGTEGEFSGWGGYKAAYTKDIYFDIVADSSTVTAGLQTGEYDIATEISNDNLDLFEDNDDYKVTLQECQMSFLVFNKQEGKGADQTVRQAIQAAINCDEVMYGTYGREDMYSIYSSYTFKDITDWYSEAGSEYYNQGDPEKALELWKEAGMTDDDAFTILAPNDDEAFYAEALICQNQLEKAGIKCELLTFDWSTYASFKYDHPDQYDAFITSFTPKVLPTLNLYLSATWSGWVSDERILGDLEEIAANQSKEDAIKIWDDLQGYMYETSVPVVKFGSSIKNMVTSSKVEGAELFEHVVYSNARVLK